MPPVGFRPFHRGDIWRSQEKIFEEQGLVRYDILRIFKREDPFLMKISSENFRNALEELGQLKFISFERKEPKPKSVRHVIGKIGGDTYANAVVAGKQLIKRIKELQCVGNPSLSPEAIDLLKDVHLHPLRTGDALKWQMEFNKFSIVPHHEAIFAKSAIRYFDEMIRQGWLSRHSEQSFLQFKRSLRFDCEPNRVDLKSAVEIYCENYGIKDSHAIPEYSTPGGPEPASSDTGMTPTAGGTIGSSTGTRMNGYATAGGRQEMTPGDAFGESHYDDDGKWAEDICRGKPDGTNWEYSIEHLFSLRSKFVELPEKILPTLLKLSPVFKLGWGYNFLCSNPFADKLRVAPEAVQDVDISDIVIRPVRRPLNPQNASHPSMPSSGINQAGANAHNSALDDNSQPGFPGGEEADQSKSTKYKVMPTEELARNDQSLKHNKPEESGATSVEHSASNFSPSQPVNGSPSADQHCEVIIKPVKKELENERPAAIRSKHPKPQAFPSGDREEAQGVPVEDAVIRKNIDKDNGERDSPRLNSRRSHGAAERPERPQPRVKPTGPPPARGGHGGGGRGGGEMRWWDTDRSAPNYGRPPHDRYYDQNVRRPSFNSRQGPEAGYDRRMRPEFDAPPRRSPPLYGPDPRYDHPPYPPRGRFQGPADRYGRDEPPVEHFPEFSSRDRPDRPRFRYPEDWQREDYYQEHFNPSPRGPHGHDPINMRGPHGHEPIDLYGRDPLLDPYYEHRRGGWRDEPRGAPYLNHRHDNRYPFPSHPKDDHRSQSHSSHRGREPDFHTNPHTGPGGLPPVTRPPQGDHDWKSSHKNPNTAWPHQQTQSEKWARGRDKPQRNFPGSPVSDEDWGPKQQLPNQAAEPVSDTGDGGGDGVENASQNIKDQGWLKKPEDKNRSYMQCFLDMEN